MFFQNNTIGRHLSGITAISKREHVSRSLREHFVHVAYRLKQFPFDSRNIVMVLSRPTRELALKS